MNILQFDEANEAIAFIPGKQHLTVSGRLTSPAPKQWVGELTDRKAANWVRRVNEWLAAEGNAEREFRKLYACYYNANNLSAADATEIAHLLADSDEDWLEIHG